MEYLVREKYKIMEMNVVDFYNKIIRFEMVLIYEE